MSTTRKALRPSSTTYARHKIMQINLNPTSERGASREAVNRPRETLGDSHLISSDPRSRFGLVCDLLCCRGNTVVSVGRFASPGSSIRVPLEDDHAADSFLGSDCSSRGLGGVPFVGTLAGAGRDGGAPVERSSLRPRLSGADVFARPALDAPRSDPLRELAAQ